MLAAAIVWNSTVQPRLPVLLLHLLNQLTNTVYRYLKPQS